MVKNLPANAEDNRFNPWSRKIPHAAEQLNVFAETIEPLLWSLGTAIITMIVLLFYYLHSYIWLSSLI